MWKKMNLNIQTPEGLKKVVADMGADVQARIAELEDMQRRILEMEATFENPGLVTLCDLPGVSDSTGKALPSSEKDATRKGTMAHDIDSLNSNFANKFYQYKKYNLSENVESHDGADWVRACYLKPGQDGGRAVNLADVLPGPFNDPDRCVIVSASIFDGHAWFISTPITTFDEHQVQATLPRAGLSAQHCALTIILMRTDI